MKKNFLYLLILLIISSCANDDESNTPDDASQELTFEKAKARYEELRLNQSGLTRTSGFPTSGTSTYKGIHGGSFFSGNSTSETKIEYYAQVVFELDFEAGTFIGTLSNVLTDLDGFSSPEGELNINGSIRDNEDLGGDEFGLRFSIQEGEITQGERTANFDGRTESKGRFTGETGEFVSIRTTATFSWISGPDSGTITGAIGFMFAERED